MNSGIAFLGIIGGNFCRRTAETNHLCGKVRYERVDFCVFGTKKFTVLVSCDWISYISYYDRFRWYLSVYYGMFGAHFDVFRRATDEFMILVTSYSEIYIMLMRLMVFCEKYAIKLIITQYRIVYSIYMISRHVMLKFEVIL